MVCESRAGARRGKQDGRRESRSTMKYLIVNADDFGASHGINRGIMEAHQRGILTSTSLLVNCVGSREAAELSRATPGLSVGLHADLRDELQATAAEPGQRLRDELEKQF